MRTEDKRFKCDSCGSYLTKPEDWFVVKDKIWIDTCQKEDWPVKGHICTECFESKGLRREIGVLDLKLTKEGGEVPMNFWIILKAMDRSRVKYIRITQEKIYANLLAHGTKEKAMRFRDRCKRVINILLHCGK
ncbi:MAG: hypothetical protein J6I84_04590 [Bacilli bacterium]|nr:hypothetical protein [Bacilli bacterium]